jgi:hypothetical protein
MASGLVHVEQVHGGHPRALFKKLTGNALADALMKVFVRVRGRGRGRGRGGNEKGSSDKQHVRSLLAFPLSSASLLLSL